MRKNVIICDCCGEERKEIQISKQFDISVVMEDAKPTKGVDCVSCDMRSDLLKFEDLCGECASEIHNSVINAILEVKQSKGTVS